jgi:hypothetical protein
MFLSHVKLATIMPLSIKIASKSLAHWDLALMVAAARRAAMFWRVRLRPDPD